MCSSSTWYDAADVKLLQQNVVVVEMQQLWTQGALPPVSSFTETKVLVRNLDDSFKNMLFKNEKETTFVCRMEFSRAYCGLLTPRMCDLINDELPTYQQLWDRELRAAIRARDVASVKQLLAEGASLTHRVRGYTPLHSCINFYSSRTNERATSSTKNRRTKEDEIIHEILTVAAQSSNKSDILDSLDVFSRTPLCMAIERGDLKTVDALVSAGANFEFVRGKNDSALHIAARNCHRTDCHIMKYFLDNCNVKNETDVKGNAPIHYAIESGVLEAVKLLMEKFGDAQLTWHNNEGSTAWHAVAGNGSNEIALYLLEVKYRHHRTLLNVVDNDGYTPVCKSVMNGYLVMTALLLGNGASLSVKGEKVTAVKLIARTFANPTTFFEEVFDSCINEKENFLKVDYEVLTDDEELTQINVMEGLVKCGQSKLLKHPVIESLVYLKWRCVLPVFYTIIATYAVFLIVLNVFVITTFNNIDMNKRTESDNASMTKLPSESCGWQYWTMVGLMYLIVGVCITQETIWIYLQRLRYLAHKESWLKLCVLALSAAVPTSIGCSPTPGSITWQRHLACFALLLAWLQAMLLLSRFPGWGYYVLMFERVAINILKILVTSICLIVGFSICFMIQYHSRPPFDGPVAGFIKTLVMMLSEFDYEHLFDENHAELENTREVIRLLFVFFVIFIAIVLMNFMIGVAVSDINELNVIGNIRRLEKQVELLSTLEGLRNTVLAKWWKRLSCVRYHRAICRPLVMPGRKWIVLPRQYYVYPADLLEMFKLETGEALTSKLQRSIHNIARKKRQNLNKLDAVYNAVVEILQHPKLDKEGDDPSAKTLKDRIKLIEDSNKEIMETNKEIKQSIDDLKKNVEEILGCLVSKSFESKSNVFKSSTSETKIRPNMKKT